MGNGRGDVKGENYFSGFASLVFGLRGWGGVFNIRRRTSSGFTFGSSSLRGFFPVAIGKSSESQENSSNKDVLKDWVGEFLSYWEDSGMLAFQAAEIIIDEFFKVHPYFRDVSRKDLYLLPNPESFFEAR